MTGRKIMAGLSLDQGSEILTELLGGHNALSWMDSFAKHMEDNSEETYYKLDSFDHQQNDGTLSELMRQHFIDSRGSGALHVVDVPATCFDYYQTFDLGTRYRCPFDSCQHSELDSSHAFSSATSTHTSYNQAEMCDDAVHTIGYTDIEAACVKACTCMWANATCSETASLGNMEQKTEMVMSPVASLPAKMLKDNSQARMSEEDAVHTVSSTDTAAIASIEARPCMRGDNIARPLAAGLGHMEQGLKMRLSWATSTCTLYSHGKMLEDAGHTACYTADMACGGTVGSTPSIWVDRATLLPNPMECKEILYRAAAMQPLESSCSRENAVPAGKLRRNVRISKDPQSMAARQRRQRISDKVRELQRLVPGGMKLDTAGMLEEAANYVRFLRAEVEKMGAMEEWITLKIAGPKFKL